LPNQPPSAISMADVQTAASYAALAVLPIHRYASQYGPNQHQRLARCNTIYRETEAEPLYAGQFEGLGGPVR
jgi:hypothetical protein